MNLSEVMADIERRAAERNAEREGDYYKDGLLMCGRCRTPKQTRINLMGIEKTVFCICRCGQEEERREAERIKAEDEALQKKRLREDLGEMANCTFDRDDGKNDYLTGIAKRYVEHFTEVLEDGKGLLLFGNCGTGKTYIAACICNALIDRGYTCAMTSFVRVTNDLFGMSSGRNDYIDRLMSNDLLVIDDLAAERETDYMNEIVTSVIDARCKTKKPLIVTTNLTAEQLKRTGDIRKQRIYSRLFEMCIPIEVKGEDRRRNTLISDYNRFSEILGLRR